MTDQIAKEQLLINKAAQLMNLSGKHVASFLQANKEKRYLLVWGWLHDPTIKTKYKAFKELMLNLDTKSIYNWTYLQKKFNEI